MKNKLWGINSDIPKSVHVCLFVSRNKDNKGVDGFKERRQAFVTDLDKDDPHLIEKFEDFCGHGVFHEFCRMYYSVNERNPEKIYKELLHFLIDNPDFNLCSIQGKIAGIAAKKECAKTKKWMFDFDCNSINKVQEFMQDISNSEIDIQIELYKTPHGYAIVTNKGFDCRQIIDKWEHCATLKKDDLLLVRYNKNR